MASTLKKKLYEACLTLDITKISNALREGVNINQTDDCGESLLCDVILNLSQNEEPRRYQITRFLLDHGADPNLLDEGRQGPLTTLQLWRKT